LDFGGIVKARLVVIKGRLVQNRAEAKCPSDITKSAECFCAVPASWQRFRPTRSEHYAAQLRDCHCRSALTIEAVAEIAVVVHQPYVLSVRLHDGDFCGG
jgi:hypothetical protein